MLRRTFVTLSILTGLGPAALAQTAKPVRIGVLNDLSGVYADYQGQGSLIAAQLAVEDFGGKVSGQAVEVLSADHQNKPDVGATIARRWYDIDGVDIIIDVPNSAVAIAVHNLAREKNKVFIGSGAGTSELTGKSCSPNTVHWTYDTWMLGQSFGKAMAAQGGKKWYFITAYYAFGKDLEKNTADAVVAAGGQVLGASRHPIGATDFSSFVVQAQNSGADVIGLANAGDDMSNALMQAAEFGATKSQRIAGIIANVNNIHGLGLKTAQGLQVVTPFYWDMNDATRAFAKRFQDRHPRKNMPNDMQAGVYAATLHYLKAVEQAKGASDGKAVVDAMKAMPTHDPLFGNGTVRADGRKLHPVYLMSTKKPEESKQAWDYLTHVRTIPAEEAFRPLHEGGCPLVSQ
jgi:branched-chain amino acid transport system substrate-binding protein